MTVKRIRFIQELLAFTGLGGRVHLEWISSAEAQKFVHVVTEFTEKIRSLGPNPLRDTGGSSLLGSQAFAAGFETLPADARQEQFQNPA